MPAALLPSFGVSEPKDFYSGGSAGQVEGHASAVGAISQGFRGGASPSCWY